MRILHCIADLHIGGTGRLLLQNLQELRKLGVDGTVVSIASRSDLVKAYSDEEYAPLFVGHRGAWTGFRTVARLRRIIDRERPDVVHTNLWLDRLYAGIAAKLENTPVVATIHSTLPPPRLLQSEPRFRRFLWSLVLRAVADRWVRVFVAVSETARTVAMRDWKYPPEKVQAIYSGVDTSMSASAHARSVDSMRLSLGIPSGGDPVLVCVGRLHPIKGHDVLIEAVSILRQDHPEIALVLVGNGQEIDNLRAQVRELSLEGSVVFVGFQRDVDPYLRAADLFVLSSRSEAMPMALLEAMAAGLPVVVSDLPSTRELVENSVNGVLAPSGARGLANAVQAVLSRDDRGVALGVKARQTVLEKFSATSTARALKRLYEEVSRVT